MCTAASSSSSTCPRARPRRSSTSARTPLARLERGLDAHPLLATLRSLAGESALAPAGCFKNRRTRVGPLEVEGQPLFLELDRTEFPGDLVHCEVELEVPAGLERAAGDLLEKLLAEARVEGAPAESKAARFFRAARTTKQEDRV